MSEATWFAEFAPKHKEDCKSLNLKRAARACLQRWKGMRKANLIHHGVKKENMMAMTLCPLCEVTEDLEHTFPQIAFLTEKDSCHICPLYLVRGKVKCDSPIPGIEKKGPWRYACSTNSVKGLVAWLTLAVCYVESSDLVERITPLMVEEDEE